MPITTLNEATSTGWATHTSESGERIRCLLPALLPAVVAADAAGVEPSGPFVRTVVEASGLLEDTRYPSGQAAERARRAATSLVRDARFSRRVLDAYGRRCCMCGLGLTLVQGAHIYPASAPGSYDEPWNGLALCGNHHLAFDRHILAVSPTNLQVAFHPEVLSQASSDPATAALIHNTLPTLRPAAPRCAPDPRMFTERYRYYGDRYDWFIRS